MSLSSCASAFTVSDYTAAGHCTSSSSPHAFPHVHQHLIVGVETDEAQPGKFEIEDDVQGKRRVDVLPELFPKGGLRVGWKHVEPKVGGADRVGFLDHEMAPRIPPRRGTRESERDQKTQ